LASVEVLAYFQWASDGANHGAHGWQLSSDKRAIARRYLGSGTALSLLDVNKKDLHLGLSINWFASIIVSLDKELAMSAAEYGLTPQPPFLSPLSRMPYEQPSTGAEALTGRYEAVSRLSRAIASVPPEILSRNLVAFFQPFFQCDLVNIVIFDQEENDIRWKSLGEGQLVRRDIPIEETTVWSVYDEQRPLWIADCQHDDRVAVQKETQNTVEYRSLCRLPLSTPRGCFGVLSIAGAMPHSYSDQEVRLLLLAADQVALGMANVLLDEELRKIREEVVEEKAYVENEPGTGREPLFEEIVGRSPALQRLLRQVEVVAPTDSGVLIQGETGTGKELIAQAIHNRSGRRDRPFIKVNCAAIPSGLLESELFGHEKGAFTGAVMRKPGRFEVADKGTLFLDEVGDIPLDLQSKLLRVLQEREFERLGSTRTQQVDVRVVAATHRDLKQMVEDGTFRSDLYYRLHVFPLVVPPLRDRGEDIPLIVRHFVEKYARRMNRHIETIPARTMEALTTYSWPGNVRELQNFVERAVILSPGTSLRAPLEELKQETKRGACTSLSTLEEMEREHVLRALRESNWVTGGPNGAAVRLGMKRTTLAYRIRRLKIPVRPQ
jgi:formate hydrogenlyase transcriptional activator